LRGEVGDRNAYLAGLRLDTGPRMGRHLRFSVGGDVGLLFIPDTFNKLDMMVIGVKTLALVVRW
jgi:hypothetical protein